jgi:serine/threonine-protein kinase
MAIAFGRYELLKKLASGGMGQVFLARTGAKGFEKLVVLKRILPHLVEDEEFFTMFIDEARISLRLNHPNIAQMFELGEENGAHFIAMEYVASDDVRRMSRKAKDAGLQVPLGVIIRIIADAAAGLDHAHKVRDARGVVLNLVHRDVSPQNILVGFDGGIKLIDFGVAKAAGRAQHTATGILKGKFPYMSPEQAEGEDIDARSDVFALGIVLWELLTERRLFKGENDIVTQKLVKACKVPPPSAINAQLPKELDAIVLKALAKNRDDRFADALGLRMALEDFALAKRIPASAAHVAAFMQPLYGERIAAESDPDLLDELSSESQVDPINAGSASRSRRNSATPMTSPPGAEAPSAGEARPHTQAVTAPSRRARGRKSNVMVIAGTACILAAGVLAVIFRPGPRPEAPINAPVVETPKPPPDRPVQQPEVTRTPDTPAPPEETAFKLESEPTGADIELGGKKLGTTPFDVTVALSELPATVKLSRDGFEPKETTLTAEGPRTLSLQLKKKVKTNRPPPPLNIKTGR